MRSSSYGLKLLAVLTAITILFIIAYRNPNERMAPTPDATQPASASAAAPDTPAVAAVPTPPPAALVRPKVASRQPVRPVAPAPHSVGPAARNPVQSAPVSAEPVPKSAAVVCSQIVLRNGDLIDAQVREIGTQEIRYKKCHWPDGPEYVISRADALSIRFANGEVERL